jgi:hypothetical protein
MHSYGQVSERCGWTRERILLLLAKGPFLSTSGPRFTEPVSTPDIRRRIRFAQCNTRQGGSMADSNNEEIEQLFAELGLETEDQRSRFRSWATGPTVVGEADTEIRLYGVTNTSVGSGGWVHGA